MRQGKLVWKTGLTVKKVECIPYDEHEDYCKFLERMHAEGYRQVILTTEIILAILKRLDDIGYDAKRISIDKNNGYFDQSILSELDGNVVFVKHFAMILGSIHSFAAMPDLLMQRVELEKVTEDVESDMWLQANGCIGFDDAAVEVAVPVIVEAVQKCLFG